MSTGLDYAVAEESPRMQWLRERQKGIGGSDAAAVVGLSKWTTRYQLYLDKTEPVVDTEPTDAQEWGILLEPLIRQRYCNKTGRSVEIPAHIIEHPELPWCLANPDGITVERDRIFEAKTAAWDDDEWGEEGTADVPDAYALQVQHYMAVTGISVADIAVLFRGSQFRIYTVPADPVMQRNLLKLEAEFWDSVQRREPPHPSDGEDAKLRWPTSRLDGLVYADPDDVEAWEELLDVRRRIAELDEEKKKLELALKKKIADASGIQHEGRPLVTWKNNKNSLGFDMAKFQEDHPELVEQYAKLVKGARTFLVKNPPKAKK